MPPGEVLLQALLVEEELLTDAALELLRHLREVLLLDVRAQAARNSAGSGQSVTHGTWLKEVAMERLLTGPKG